MSTILSFQDTCEFNCIAKLPVEICWDKHTVCCVGINGTVQTEINCLSVNLNSYFGVLRDPETSIFKFQGG